MQTDNDMVTIAQNRDEAEYQEAETKLLFGKLIVDIFQRTEIYRLHYHIRSYYCKDPSKNFSTAFKCLLERITKLI